MRTCQFWKLLLLLAICLAQSLQLLGQQILPRAVFGLNDPSSIGVDHEGFDIDMDSNGNLLLKYSVTDDPILFDSLWGAPQLQLRSDFPSFTTTISEQRHIWMAGKAGQIAIYDMVGTSLDKFQISDSIRSLLADPFGNVYAVIGNPSGFGVIKFSGLHAVTWAKWYLSGTGNQKLDARWGFDQQLYVQLGNRLYKIDPSDGHFVRAWGVGMADGFTVDSDGSLLVVRKVGLAAQYAKYDSVGTPLWARTLDYTPIVGAGSILEHVEIGVDPASGSLSLIGQLAEPFGNPCYLQRRLRVTWLDTLGNGFAGNNSSAYFNRELFGKRQSYQGHVMMASGEDFHMCMAHNDDHGFIIFHPTIMNLYCVPAYYHASTANTPTWLLPSYSVGDSSRPVVLATLPLTSDLRLFNPLTPCNACPLPTPAWMSQSTLPLTQVFTSISTSTAAVLWDFGDGATSASPNPTHTYPASGWYRVTLYATNLCGTDSLSQWINLCANAQMNGPTSGCVGQQVSFQNTSTPGGLPATWLVDGTVMGTGQQLIWTPTTAGTFSIGLIVQNQTCTDTVYRNYIAAGPAPLLPADTAICTNVNFTLQAGGGQWPIYHWSTGQGGSSIVISQPGTYWVQATDNQGCTGRDSITIGALPTPDATISHVPNGLTIHFSPFVPSPGTYWWSFGDGATDTSMQATHTYASPFFYNVCLRIDAPNGCVDSSCILLQVLPTGQESPVAQAQLSVQTSPDHPRIHVRASLPGPAAAHFRLHDLAGRTLWAQAPPPDMDFDFEIPAEGWAAGCYLLSLEAGEGRVVRRVMLR